MKLAKSCYNCNNGHLVIQCLIHHHKGRTFAKNVHSNLSGAGRRRSITLHCGTRIIRAEHHMSHNRKILCGDLTYFLAICVPWKSKIDLGHSAGVLRCILHLQVGRSILPYLQFHPPQPPNINPCVGQFTTKEIMQSTRFSVPRVGRHTSRLT